MFTINYKGFYIRGYCDKPEVYVNAMFNQFKSLHAAKCWVSRVAIPAHDEAMLEYGLRVNT
jgi:hypothetical protein